MACKCTCRAAERQRAEIDAAVAAERESCAKVADWAAGQCLQHARHPTLDCEDPECCEQRSMAKACENVAAAIRARGGK